MRILFLFLDGIGLGEDDARHNPFAVAHLPTLHSLTSGRRWLRGLPRLDTDRATFIPTDACLGVAGRPQSATGQAALMSGINVPLAIGEHYGPRPNQAIRDILMQHNLLLRLRQAAKTCITLDAYPPPFFHAVERGKRLLSSLQFAAVDAGVPLRTKDDYYAGQAISPDWTGQGWRDTLGFADAPVYSPALAGQLLAHLAQSAHFTLASTWVTDQIGHRGPLEDGVFHLEIFDSVLAALLAAWDDAEGLIVLTSDHGNLEDLSIRQHTLNAVPTVAIGNAAARQLFAEGLQALPDVPIGIQRVLGVD